MLNDKRISKRKLPDTLSMAGQCTYLLNLNLDLGRKKLDSSIVTNVSTNMVACKDSLPKSYRAWERLKKYLEHLLKDSDASSTPGSAGILASGNGQDGF